MIFARQIIAKHEKNVVKSGLNIIPARNVKMSWIVKVILQNLKRQFIWKIFKMIFNIDKFLKCGKQLRWARNCSACQETCIKEKKNHPFNVNHMIWISFLHPLQFRALLNCLPHFMNLSIDVKYHFKYIPHELSL